ncbi:MAG: NifB/NifX family molybdenum-iron cluster-binding protein [bacterium]|nr:MAG: NifB/NifX family molybdenum-iron cluster-binding protein [bacterium]
MKLAIPIWNGRVSPVFDAARQILVVDVPEGGETSRREHQLSETYLPLRIRRLEAMGVDVLICGAISNPIAALVEAAGIRIYPWVSGDVEDVIEAFQKKDLESPRYYMPGFGGRRCRRGMRGRSRRGRGGNR